MDHGFLFSAFILLASACIVVPLASRLKLGSVLGYLAAGIAIGPYGFGLITNAEQILHFAEFGVVMMLFVIGLELEPATLWRLKKTHYWAWRIAGRRYHRRLHRHWLAAGL